MREVLNRWLTDRSQVLSTSTSDRYRGAIRHVELHGLGSLPVGKLRPHHIEDLYTAMLRSGLSGASIRKVHWPLRQALAWAHRRGYTPFVATDGIELPPLGEKRANPPDSAHVRQLVEFALGDDPTWGTAIAFSAWTGCRRGEVCGLQWRDLDLDSKSALIRRSVAGIPGGVEIKGTKTGEVRRIALGTKTVELLQSHRERCEERALRCGSCLVEGSFVFSPDVSGSDPYNPRSFTRVFVQTCRSAGVPHMRLHDLRHHSATALLKHGTSVGEVMDRHGWKTVSMVTRYRHLLEATDAGAAEALENA